MRCRDRRCGCRRAVPRRPGPGRLRGAALLAALLVAALVATLASAGVWQQWRAIEVESAERERSQSAWVLSGALDWARLILREDAQTGQVDHLAEPWAVPLREARLSTFLAADRSAAAGDSAGEESFLSGEITDLQSRLNVNDLVESGRVSGLGLTAFQRLFDLLGLPQAELETMVANLQAASLTAPGSGRGSRPPASPDGTGTASSGGPGSGEAPAPLMPHRPEQLGWLGLSPPTVATLLPYVTVLPGRTTVNANTASAQVIYAAIGGIGLADAQRIVNSRQGRPLRGQPDVMRLLTDTAGAAPVDGLLGWNSSFFEVRARLRLSHRVIEERTMVQRADGAVRVLQRERSVVDAAVPAAAPAGA